jgi:pilus assembly protein CpaE
MAISRNELGQVINKGPNQKLTPNQRGKVLTLFSPTSRVGKTTLTVNLAGALSLAGQNVCIVDADLQTGDVCHYLGIEPHQTIVDVCSGDIGEFEVADRLVYWRDTIWLIPAPIKIGDDHQVNHDKVSVLIQRLQESFDYVIVDTAAGFSEITLVSLEVADLIIFVCILDYLPSVKNVQLSVGTLEDLGYLDKTRLILNRANARSALERRAVEAVLKHRFDFTFLNDYQLTSQAIGQGVPFVLSHSEKSLSRQIHRFAAVISAGVVGTSKQSLFIAAKAWLEKVRLRTHKGSGA